MTGPNLRQKIKDRFGSEVRDAGFAHEAFHELPSGLTLANSYHCSRYNTNTRRLTTEMFRAVFQKLRDRLDG